MAEPSFLLHVGGSVYLDASGTLQSSVPERATVYPGVPLHVDPGLLAKALREFVDAPVSPDELAERWSEASGDDPTVQALIQFGNMIAIVGGILMSVVNPAPTGVILGTLVGGIVSTFDGGGGFDATSATALARLAQQFAAQADLEKAETLLEMRSSLQGKFEAIRSRVSDLVTHNPTAQARLDAFKALRELVDDASDAVARIRDEEWKAVNSPDDFLARFSLSTVLRRVGVDGSLEPVEPRDDRLVHFDPRLGIPMLLWAGSSYAAMTRLAIPWMRTDGSFREQLRALASRIDDFVVSMQADCWARTEHDYHSLLLGTNLYFGTPFETLIGQPLSATRGTYPVGAFDLVRYSDSYIWARWMKAVQQGTDRGDVGLLDYTWEPSPGLVDAFGNPTDLDQLREAANTRARSDYARLVATSGAPHLMLTSALLRHLSAPPTRSETVVGDATAGRTPTTDEETTATSPVVFPNVQVRSAATLRHYESFARVRLTTQRPGHNPAVDYRVVLRTIDSRFGHEGWRADGYEGRVWDADLVPLPNDPRNMRLRTDFRKELVLSDVPLYEGKSPAEPFTVKRSPEPQTVRAATFDWYLPVRAPAWSQSFTPGALEQTPHIGAFGSGGLAGARSIHMTGGLSDPIESRTLLTDGRSGAPIQHVRSGERDSYADLTRMTLAQGLELGDWYAAHMDVDLSAAERRHVRVEDVTLDYEMHWKDGELEILLFGLPSQRPYQVWVVIEEKVQSGVADGSREVLHTAMAAELVNQVILVPESFFREEGAALDAAGRLWEDLKRRFSEVAQVGLEDPVIRIVHDMRESLVLSPSTATLASGLAEAIDVVRQHHPDVWEQVAERR